MNIKHIFSKIPRDPDFPERVWKQLIRNMILDGSLYDVLENEYYHETEHNQRRAEHERKPSTRVGLNLIRMTAEDFVAFLFGEGRFPTIHHDDKRTREILAKWLKNGKVADRMRVAALKGQTGSVALRLRIIKSKPFVDVLDTTYLTPVWKLDDPDTLLKVVERYKVKGSVLADIGYNIPSDEMATMWWFQREFTEFGETWFHPVKAVVGKKPVMGRDAVKSVPHTLGFVPIVWVKNTADIDANAVDGGCVFDRALETCILIDYRISGANRALRQSSDPILLIKDEDYEGEERTATDGIVTSTDGDAKLLEISGQAAAAVDTFVEKQREFALEIMHAVRASPDRVASATSGLALKLLYAPTLRHVDTLRASYGEHGLLELARMLIRASKIMPIHIGNTLITETTLDDDTDLSLVWPDWFGMSSHDRLENSQSLQTLMGAGVLSQETALRSIATDLDIENIELELSNIKSNQAEADLRLAKQNAQVQATTNSND